MPATFPTSAEVTAFLLSLGINVPGSYDVNVELQAVIEQLSELTGWNPFLTTGTDETRFFDPPYSLAGGPMNPNGGVVIPLRAGLLDVTTVRIGSRILTRGTEYWLEPSYSKPWNRIRLNFSYWSKPQQVEVIGKWGYSESVPSELFVAIRDLAAYQVIANTKANQIMSGVEGWKEGDVSESFSSNQIRTELANKQSRFERVCSAYRKVF